MSLKLENWKYVLYQLGKNEIKLLDIQNSLKSKIDQKILFEHEFVDLKSLNPQKYWEQVSSGFIYENLYGTKQLNVALTLFNQLPDYINKSFVSPSLEDEMFQISKIYEGK